MGRLYSGNLNDFKSACNRLFQLDFAVISEDFVAEGSYVNCMYVRVEDRAGSILAQETFGRYDEDALYITATSWLNRIASQLETWSKY